MPSATSLDPLPTAIWQALTTSQQDFAQLKGSARRYPAAVAPFAAVDTASPDAFHDLATLLKPEEAVYLLDTPLTTAQASPLLSPDGLLAGLQMDFPADTPLPPEDASFAIERLDCRNADEMLALITLAYPGFFRSGTCRMGPYFGIRDRNGQLIAMGGTRLAFHPWYEISGLCCHPAHAGRGLGTAILRHLLAQHRQAGACSFLHVSADNGGAVALYTRMGFRTLRSVALHRVRKIAS